MLKIMTLHISTGDGVVGYGAVYLYWRRCGRIWCFRLYWGRCGRVCRLRSGDVVVGNGATDVSWGRCGRVWCC